ncbi:Lrp/AsnC family transcriptional regulator [Altererythrobacter fulvus]|uniref:Lrp/AsnC family transcriptional regulator n=1 Tax=Caenibius fulvus TaxID=2126012 RepID=UPI0030174A29
MKQDVDLDRVDRKILALVQRDATLSHAEIAERVGASSASCWRRIKAMEAAGYLIGSVRLVDPNRVGRGVTVICNVRAKDFSPAASQAFEEFVHDSPEVVECYSMSGDWDFLLRIVASDVADYNSFLMDKLLRHPTVAGASSHFALETLKYTTELPV